MHYFMDKAIYVATYIYRYLDAAPTTAMLGELHLLAMLYFNRLYNYMLRML